MFTSQSELDRYSLVKRPPVNRKARKRHPKFEKTPLHCQLSLAHPGEKVGLDLPSTLLLRHFNTSGNSPSSHLHPKLLLNKHNTCQPRWTVDAVLCLLVTACKALSPITNTSISISKQALAALIQLTPPTPFELRSLFHITSLMSINKTTTSLATVALVLTRKQVAMAPHDL